MIVPPPKWSVDDMPDLSGKVAIVTGGNANIGKETVKVSYSSSEPQLPCTKLCQSQALLVHNAKVYLAARNAGKAQAVIHALREETGKEAIFMMLDLASLESVRMAADGFLRCVVYVYYHYVSTEHPNYTVSARRTRFMS